MLINKNVLVNADNFDFDLANKDVLATHQTNTKNMNDDIAFKSMQHDPQVAELIKIT